MKTSNSHINPNRIVILGAGESGVGTAILAKSKGYAVFVSDFGAVKENYATTLDENEIKWEQGGHTESQILEATLVMKSPGISDKAPIVQKIKAKGISIVSEIEFAAQYTDATIIGITGSNGKTTTTTLCYEILKNEGYNVGLGGNIGQSFAYQVATEDYDFYVLELSSFQLDDIENFRPDVAVLMNITPDHLDRYDYNFDNYIASKFRITKNQKADDSLIYCADDEVIATYIKENKIEAQLLPFSLKDDEKMSGFIQNEQLTINHKKKIFTMSIYDLGITGQHNVYNSLAAGIVSKAVGVRKETIRESLSNFKNLEHRMEKVLRIGGIEFVNDSKATNVNSTWYAMESMENPLVWIAGGVDKGNEYEALTALVNKKVHTIICLGEDNRNLHQAFSRYTDLMINVHSMKEAVKVANHFANKGDSVLLSPACASFDLFENYEDRGDQFKKAVKNL